MVLQRVRRARASSHPVKAGLLALALLAVMACSSGGTGACPQYEMANSVTIDASPFFAAHATAYELCVSQLPCVVRRPGVSHVGTGVLSGEASELTLRITILTRENTKLIDETIQVRLHQVAYGTANCARTALGASVAVTAQGALSVR